MKVNSISGNNYYNSMNNKQVQKNCSEPAFRGKNFAQILANDYTYSALRRNEVLQCFIDLMTKASKEPGFKVINEELYGKMQAVKSSDDLRSLMKDLYKNKKNVTEKQIIDIASDSEGPVIQYVNTPVESKDRFSDGIQLRFLSEDIEGKVHNVYINASEWKEFISQDLTTSDNKHKFYAISSKQYYYFKNIINGI